MTKNLIIVIDDVKVCQDFIKLLFDFYTNYKTICYYTAMDALEGIKTQYDNIALIILDLTLPDISGIDLFKILYEENYLSNIPILFQSGYNFDLADKINISSKESLKIEFLAKPFTKEKLFAKITDLLGENWLDVKTSNLNC